MRTMTRLQSRSRATRRRRGVQILEFCVVLPVMMFLVMFCMDMSRLLMIRGVVGDATYRAARAGAAVGDATATSAGDQSRSVSQAAFANSMADAPVPTDVRNSARITVAQNCSASSNYVQIDASYDVALMSPGLGQLLNFATGATSSIPDGYHVDVTSKVRCEVKP